MSVKAGDAVAIVTQTLANLEDGAVVEIAARHDDSGNLNISFGGLTLIRLGETI
jgi:hypothetical protein